MAPRLSHPGNRAASTMTPASAPCFSICGSTVRASLTKSSFSRAPFGCRWRIPVAASSRWSSIRSSFPRALMVGLRGRLPVHTVEVTQLERRRVDAFDTAHVEYPAPRIEPRTRKGMNAAMPAEVMLRGLRVELVEDELRFAGHDLEVCLGRRVP